MAGAAGRPHGPESLRKELRKALPAALTDVLFPALTWRITGKRCTVMVPNPVWEDIFERYAREALLPILAASGLSLVVRSRLDSTADGQNRKASFENFLEDPGNQFARSACRGILEAPGLLHNPLFLHGAGGCGKTHLLHAVAGEYRQMLGPEAAVELSGPRFVAHDAQVLADRQDSELRNQLEQATVVTIDEVDAVAERQLAQEELYLLINRCLDQGQQLVIAGRHAPRRLAGLEDRLSTRLGWGLTIAIDLPQPETRLALLTRLAAIESEEMDQQELQQLIDTQAPDMHQVIALAERLRAGERISSGPSRASFDRIIGSVATAFGVRPGDIAGKHRHRQVVQARQAALLLGRRLTDHSLAALGGMVGGRDHSTVLYSLRQAEQRLSDDAEFSQLIGSLSQDILGGEG